MANINKVVITEDAEFDYEEILGLPMPKVLQDGQPSLPDYPYESYYRTIEEGYHDCGLDTIYLKEALADTKKRKKKQ